MKNKWMPEIYYEETHEGPTSGLPFIKVPEDHSMPGCLFMCEVRDVSNDEVEKEIAIHSYANMMLLKEKLSESHYDVVRQALGLLPLKEATQKGQKINGKINKNIDVK